MANKKQQETEERKHRTYRVQDTPYFSALKKIKKAKTTVSNVLEDVVVLIAAGYGVDIVASLDSIKGTIAAKSKKVSK